MPQEEELFGEQDSDFLQSLVLEHSFFAHASFPFLQSDLARPFPHLDFPFFLSQSDFSLESGQTFSTIRKMNYAENAWEDHS